ncbi:Uncharacterised protein [Eubacterium limosum]|uniref:Oligosaccharide repeat unit polymerase n=1 Tax=Eubacterium limosum TaxID=1736 RepID=A0A6N3HF55_EUBLI
MGKGCKMSKKTFIFLFFYIVYYIIFAFWAYSIWKTPPSNYEAEMFPWFVYSLVFNLFGFIFVKKINYINIAFWFVILSYLFMFGHIITSVFNLETTLLWRPGDYFSTTNKFYASVYAQFALNSIAIGAIIVQKPKENPSIKTVGLERSSYFELKNMKTMGWILFLIGFLTNMISSAKAIGITTTTGSYTSLASGVSSGVLDDFGFFMIPGFAYILSSKSLTKRKSFWFTLSVCLYYMTTMVFSGSRRLQLYAIIVVVICYLWSTQRKSFSLKTLFFVVVGGIFFLDLIYVIRENRTDVMSIVPAFLEQLTSFQFLGNVVGETLTETGISFYSVVAILSTVPSVFPYELGMTFIRTIPSILPIGWLVGDFFNKAASTYVINRYTGLPVGSSLIGDFYWNFGFIGGIVLSLFFGIFIEKISVNLLKKTKYTPLYFSFMYAMLIGLRSGVVEIFRPMLMVLIIPWIIRYIRIRRR